MIQLFLTADKGGISPFILIVLFVVATIVGYFLISHVPSLLHTPLMSGMNALSGMTILGALTAVSVLFKDDKPILSALVGGLAIVLAMINVIGGFGVTHRMLKMFQKRGVRK